MEEKKITKEKIWSFLAGVGSTMVMVLAFFIPSVQDQYDRYQSRKVITQYEVIGDNFNEEERYDMAEQAYARAFELSENKRLDIEIKRLSAKINRINLNPKWGAVPPDDLEEIDFQYVLHLQTGKENQKDRIATLNSYGIFLAASKKPTEAKAAFMEAIKLDSTEALSYVNLGNLYDQQHKKKAALENYQKAISRDKNNIGAYYNLGLLYYEQGNLKEAEKALKSALVVDSTDTDVLQQYNLVVKQLHEEEK